MSFVDKNFNYIIATAVIIGVIYWIYDERTKSAAVLNDTSGGGINNRIRYVQNWRVGDPLS